MSPYNVEVECPVGSRLSYFKNRVLPHPLAVVEARNWVNYTSPLVSAWILLLCFRMVGWTEHIRHIWLYIIWHQLAYIQLFLMLVFIYSYFSVCSLLTAIPQFVLHIQPFSSFSFTYSYFSVCFSHTAISRFVFHIQLFLGLFFTYSYLPVCSSQTAISQFVL